MTTQKQYDTQYTRQEEKFFHVYFSKITATIVLPHQRNRLADKINSGGSDKFRGFPKRML